MSTSEKDFSSAIEDLLDILGYKWCHFRPARTEHGWRTALSGHKGMLDYIAVKDGRFLVFELKSDTGKVSSEQQDWIDKLKNCKGIECYVWRPADWNELVRIMQGGNSWAEYAK